MEQLGDGPPPALLWLRLYCGFQLFFFLLMAGMGAVMIALPLIDPITFAPAPGEPPMWVFGGIIVVIYGPMLIVYAIGLAAPRRPWMYIYGIAICALSMVCGGCWPMAIPALVYWLKPELKAWLEA